MRSAPGNAVIVASYSEIIGNLRQGDCVFLDIDETMLLVDPLTKKNTIRNADLALEIKQLQEMGILVYGLTSSDNATVDKKRAYLISHDIALADIFSSHDDSLIFPSSYIQSIVSENQPAQVRRIIVISGSPAMIAEIQGSYREAKANDVEKNIKLLCYQYNAPQNLSLDNKIRTLRHLQLQDEISKSQYIQQPTINDSDVSDIDVQPIDRQLPSIFPANLNDYVFVKALGGGTKSTFLIQHKTSGHKLVIKAGASEEQIQLEILSNNLYQALGVRTPRLEVYNKIPLSLLRKLKEVNDELYISVNGVYQVCEYIEPTADYKSQTVRGEIRSSVANHFIAHVLLGNIDIAKYDNLIAAADGTIYTIDAGTNFIFRAKGNLRTDDLDIVSEVDSLRNSSINKTGAEWFGQLTDEEIRMQIVFITQNIDAIEKVLWDVSAELGLSDELRLKYVEIFSKRLDYLISRYCPELQHYAKVDKASEEGVTSAGIMTYAYINDVPHILLTKRRRHEWYDNFGGKSDKGDLDVINTAIREVAEESSNTLNYTRHTLLNSPFHDQIREDARGNLINYRMYIAENRYVENIKLTEHTEMVWIPIATMLEGLKNPSLVQSENKTTISIVDPVSQKPIIIFPPLLKMLENSEVQAYLSAVLNKKTIRAGHTQSVFFENANKRSDSSARSAVSAAALAAAPSTTSSGESTTSANVANQTSRKPHSPSSIKARPIASPDSVKTQITQTVLNRVKVVQELNERNKSHAEPVGSADSGMRTLSQSEIHMKAILQDKFIEGDLEANVRNMLAQYKKHNGESRFEISEILIKKCVEMLEAEKNNGTDYVYFYHSCDSQIAFCYAIYQKIYANLHANNDWSAFRFDQDKFKKFKNIQEFAAYYSNNGSQEINNNVPGYADLALSTNVFLFGNHQQPGSSSIDYMVNNTVAREVELEKMLSEALLPLSIDSNTVASLVSFYHSTFRSQHGSEMYQIMIPKSDVHSVSYPSVTMGKESRLNGESNISNIISTLNDCVTSQQLDDSTLKYIKKLQARWYASPATFVKSNKTSWHKMTSAEQEKLNATNIYNQLNLFADNILSQVLTHSPSDSVLDNDASAFRMVREVNKLNKTPTLFFMSSKDAFARLILSSNEHNIRNYLNKNPAAINQGINYVAETTFNTVSMVNLSPLMAMIMYSSVSVNFLSELFGADYSQNQEIIKMVPQEENDVYEELDLSEKLLYLREFKGVLTYESKLHQISPNDFISILGGLPLNQRTRLVKFAKADSQLSYLFIDYSSSNKLLKSHIQILELLPEKDKQAFYLEHKDIYSALYLNFKGTYAPIMVMKLFSTLLPSFPDLITEHHQDCLDVLKSCTFDEFISTFETASYAKRPAMFDLIGRSIQNKEEFDAILHLIPDTMQDVFSTKYLPDISAVRPTN